IPLRETVAAFASLPAADLQHVLITESARADYRIPCRHRLAQGPSSIRRHHRGLACIPVHVPFPAQGRIALAARLAPATAPIGLSLAGSGTRRMGAQHLCRSHAALFDSISHAGKEDLAERQDSSLMTKPSSGLRSIPSAMGSSSRS